MAPKEAPVAKKAKKAKTPRITKRKSRKRVPPATEVPRVPPPERKKRVMGMKNTRAKEQLAGAVDEEQRRKDKEAEMVRRYYHHRDKIAAREQSLSNMRRTARALGQYFVEPEPRLAVVVRIRGICDMPPKPRKILQILRLRQIFNAVFVRLNKSTLNLLRLVAPYIAWGYPNLMTVRKLLYRRGYCKHRGQRLRLDNELIEKNLARNNIICMEDLIYEIFRTGKHFKHANKFLWPFKLNTVKGGMKAKRRHFVEGGDYGNREVYINRFIRKMI
eukprot:NODE_3577_length_950_cov_357.466149_g3287_i0.p1 GENE.NODE_3577_length_950_cov_357.466149_g3287_i0~~NODE_3577_length_950_cov_357.466149_g3287_i0.p1  ORF type:complete len:274 (+),score=54.40 NODE_3577_length_950_cov_357.466149_g3287_i0:49-870(+)